MDLSIAGWLEKSFWGNSLYTWILALGTAILVWLAVIAGRRLVVRRGAAFAARTQTDLDDLIVCVARSTRLWLAVVVAIFAGSQWLELPRKLGDVLRGAAVLAVILQVAIWVSVGIDFWVVSYKKRRLAEDAAAATTMVALRFIGKLVLYSTLLLLALDNLGIDITALVAGLGVGGVAVALATQNILGDLFASLSIVIDKPFVIGDFIIVGDFMGTVENIGLKTTRVRSLSGEQLVFANSDLLGSRIRNYKRMAERRVVFGFGVTYQTPIEEIEALPGIVRTIIEAQEQIRFDRAHFKGFGASSLDFEVVYYVLVPDFNVYMDIQQAINLALMRQLDERGIEFAYPTQTLFIEKTPALEAALGPQASGPRRGAEVVTSE